MPVFPTVTDADIFDPSFWAGLDVDRDSRIDVSAVSDRFDIVMTASSISFTDTTTGTTTTYTDADLAGGSFSAFVAFAGNDGNSDVSGSVGLNAGGYRGGSGDDTFRDDGNLGGALTGGGGDDLLIGGSGSNNIRGNGGDDTLRGGSGNNNLWGGRGDDTLFADDGSGNLDGGSGDDVIYAGLNTTFVRGGSGTDTLLLPPGATAVPFFPGASGGFVNLPNGRSFVYLDIDSIGLVCFAQGTRVRTADGDTPIDEICEGDLVLTLDNGLQPVRWIGQRTVNGTGTFAPICFEPGSIGNRRRLRVSPQHRVLVTGWRCELLFGLPELLCAAKHLCDGDRVYSQPCDSVTYYHMMFDRHEIVLSDGACLESFFLGDHVAPEDHATRTELLAMFPELDPARCQRHKPARPFARAFETGLLRSA